MPPLFTENQRFTQWWLWIIWTAVGLLPLYMIYEQLILGNPVGTNPMPDAGVVIMTLFIYGLIGLFAIFRLKTTIDREAIRFRMYPLVSKTFLWEDIRSAEVVNYGFVGGYGIRVGSKYGTVYNIKGKTGLAIVLKNGRKLCLGTQRGDELKRVIRKCLTDPATQPS